MKKSLQGVLLSALIFPGFGHLALKQYPRGILLILTSTIGMVVIVSEALRKALLALEKIESEGGQITMEAVVAAANHAVSTSGNAIFTSGCIILALCWIVGVIDGYRVGKSIDDNAKSHALHNEEKRHRTSG